MRYLKKFENFVETGDRLLCILPDQQKYDEDYTFIHGNTYLVYPNKFLTEYYVSDEHKSLARIYKRKDKFVFRDNKAIFTRDASLQDYEKRLAKERFGLL